jgi:hypothetical protein
MTGKKTASKPVRIDPYRNFNFRVVFRSVAATPGKVVRAMKSSIDAGFLRRLRF